MGLFSTLRDKILSKITHQKRTGQKTAPSPSPTNQTPADKNQPYPPISSPQQEQPEEQQPRLTADELASQLDKLAAESSEKLEWRTSIVDLMKVVGMDSGYSDRKEMAIDLGYSEKDIDSKGSAEMNIWLHKQVLAKLSEDTDGDLSVA